MDRKSKNVTCRFYEFKGYPRGYPNSKGNLEQFAVIWNMIIKKGNYKRGNLRKTWTISICLFVSKESYIILQSENLKCDIIYERTYIFRVHELQSLFYFSEPRVELNHTKP